MVVRFRGSAFKHGLTVEAIEHAIEHWVLWKDELEGTDNVLLLGPDHAGNLLEVIGRPVGEDLIVFHVMPARAQFLALLTERKE